MSLEFALQYGCPLRADYSEQHLREWGRLSSLHAKLTTGDAAAPSIDKFEWVEKASSEIERMQQATAICAHCPACLPLEVAGDGESVGCLGRINYPIEAVFEKFLADRVQLSIRQHSGHSCAGCGARFAVQRHRTPAGDGGRRVQ